MSQLTTGAGGACITQACCACWVAVVLPGERPTPVELLLTFPAAAPPPFRLCYRSAPVKASPAGQRGFQTRGEEGCQVGGALPAAPARAYMPTCGEGETQLA